MLFAGFLSSVGSAKSLHKWRPCHILLKRCLLNSFHQRNIKKYKFPRFLLVQKVASPVEQATFSGENVLGKEIVCPRCKGVVRNRINGDIICTNCGEIFSQTKQKFYLDLVLSRKRVYKPLQQEIFQNPFVAFLYERGWRNSFRQMGYPLYEEFRLIMDFFGNYSNEPNTLIDLSCGTGYITRKLANTRKFSKIFAIDFSENMLKEAYRRMLEECRYPFTLIRADVACLPLQDEIANFIYCGAALHCWPKVQDGLYEMHRILKPGGLAFATTFVLKDDKRSSLLSPFIAYRFFTKRELEWLFKSTGFQNVTVEVNPSHMQPVQSAIIRCHKS
eukprot:jgi/Galph1/5642/GphlegSOOS_G4252.1